MDAAEQLGSVLGHFEASRYAALASSCIIFFEYFLTFDEEIEYIWKSPWTPGKVLFMLNRYYTLASAVFNNYGMFSPNVTDNFCRQFIYWQGYTGLISAMLSQMILQMRLFALYCMNRRVIIVISTFFILSSAASAAVMTQILSKITVTSHIIPQYPYCVPTGLGDHFYAFWIPIITTEAMLCFSALFRGYLSLKEDEQFEKVKRRGDGDSFLLQSGRKLIAMLIHDSVLYFLATFATYAANLIMFIAGPPTLLEIPIGFSVSIASVLSSRLILRVRHVRKEIEFVRQMSYSPVSPSPVAFSPVSPSSSRAGPSMSSTRPPVIGSSFNRSQAPAGRPSAGSSTHVNANGPRPSASSVTSTHSRPPVRITIFSSPKAPTVVHDAFSPAPTRLLTSARRSNWHRPPGLGTLDPDLEQGTYSPSVNESLGVEMDMERTPTRESCIGIAQ